MNTDLNKTSLLSTYLNKDFTNPRDVYELFSKRLGTTDDNISLPRIIYEFQFRDFPPNLRNKNDAILPTFDDHYKQDRQKFLSIKERENTGIQNGENRKLKGTKVKFQDKDQLVSKQTTSKDHVTSFEPIRSQSYCHDDQQICNKREMVSWRSPLPSTKIRNKNSSKIYKKLIGLENVDPILLDRDVYRMKLKSALKLKTENRANKRQNKQNIKSHSLPSVQKSAQEQHDKEYDDNSKDFIEELGFDPQSCQLYILSTNWSILDHDQTSSPVFQCDAMPKRKQLKCSRKYTQGKITLTNERRDITPTGDSVLLFSDKCECSLNRQPKHILETLNRLNSINETNVNSNNSDHETYQKESEHLNKYTRIQVFTDKS